MVQTQQTQGTESCLGSLFAGQDHIAMVAGAGPASTSPCECAGKIAFPSLLPHLHSDGILKPTARPSLLSSSIGFTWQGFYVCISIRGGFSHTGLSWFQSSQ